MNRRTIRLAAAVLATAAAGFVPVIAASPAAAAPCGSGTGVTVVVDFRELGGGVQSSCVAGGAGSAAASLFPSAGFPLTPVQNEPGFVCRVAGQPVPADEPCVTTPPQDAYWGLWWSDGKGSWSYSNYGVSDLKVPDGSWVGFSWKGSASAQAPGITPTTPTPAAPTPTASPTQQQPQPSATPTSGSTKPKPTPSAAPTTLPPTPNASVSVTPTPTGSATPTEASTPTESPVPTESATPESSASAEESGAVPTAEPGVVEPTSAPVDVDDGGLPAWVPVVVILLLFSGAAGVVVVRQRRT